MKINYFSTYLDKEMILYSMNLLTFSIISKLFYREKIYQYKPIGFYVFDTLLAVSVNVEEQKKRQKEKERETFVLRRERE